MPILICFAQKQCAVSQNRTGKPVSPEGCRKLAGDNIPG